MRWGEALAQLIAHDMESGRASAYSVCELCDAAGTQMMGAHAAGYGADALLRHARCCEAVAANTRATRVDLRFNSFDQMTKELLLASETVRPDLKIEM